MTRSRFNFKWVPAEFGRRLVGRIRPVTAIYSALGAGLILSATVAFPPAPVTATLKTTKAAHASEAVRKPETKNVRPVSTAPGRTATVPHEQLDALTGVIARKYRVSRQATREYLRQAWREANRHGIDPMLLIAVMAVESSFNPVAESHAGAVGLMQVIPRFHTDKFSADHESALQPDTNIRIGAKVLQEYIHRGGGLIPGLQLYNGASNDESNAYANKVLGEKARLLAALKVVISRA